MSMYVMEGLGTMLPVTHGQIQQLTAARTRALQHTANESRFGMRGLGLMIDPSRVTDVARESERAREGQRGSYPVPFTPTGPYDLSVQGDFVGTWGLPIGVGLGAIALGLVMAKGMRKRRGKKKSK